MSLGDVLRMEEQQCCPFSFCLLNSHACAELGIESEQCLLLVLLKLNVHHSELHVDVLPQLWIILITERVSDLICDCW